MTADLLLVPLIALGVTLVAAVALAVIGIRYRRTPAKHLRDFPIFRALSGEVGRAAEEGTLIHISLGSGSLAGEDAMTSLAALESLSALFDLAAAYDTPPIITTGDPTLYILADDWMRRAYARLGNAERYRPTLVQFTAATPATYAAMAATYLSEKGVGANVFMGAFDQEVSLLTDAVARRDARAIGGAVSPPGLAALFTALGPAHLVMGEDLFAGGAEATQRSVFWASLGTQDFLRWLIVIGMILTALLSVLGLGGN
ncbi:MAG: hypothetical protein JW892_15135 [Anaerolineae bacterium]|nr:hypothetical protein [Anaerolineae bacterium]